MKALHNQAFIDRKAISSKADAFLRSFRRNVVCLQVRPLRRQLKGLKAWITGQRKDQSPGTRAEIPVVQIDPAFEGLDGGSGSLVKFNPLSDVPSAEVWNFLRVMVSLPWQHPCNAAFKTQTTSA